MIDHTIAEATAPLPPVLSVDARRTPPPAALTEAVGRMVASYLYNYQQAGPIYRYPDYRLGKVSTVLTGVEANQFITHHGKELLSARTFRARQLAELGSEKYVVGMDGDDHYHARKLQKDGYARSMLDDRCPEMAQIVTRCIEQWPTDEPIPLYRFLQQVLTEQLGATLLNYASPEKWVQINHFIDSMLAASFAPQAMTDERWASYHAARDETMALADEIVDTHRKQPGQHSDLVDALLVALDAMPDLMNSQDLRISTLTPYIAGINPVAHTCSYMLWALLKHPEALAQVQTEIDAVFSDVPSPADLREMGALRGAMLEALRLSPFAPFLEMNALQSFEFMGYHVKEGTPVILATTVPHFLPEYYEDPLRFNIERHNQVAAKHRPPGAFVPYGVGPHLCLGAGYAETQMMLTMAALLRAVEVELDPASPMPKAGPHNKDALIIHIRRRRI